MQSASCKTAKLQLYLRQVSINAGKFHLSGIIPRMMKESYEEIINIRLRKPNEIC